MDDATAPCTGLTVTGSLVQVALADGSSVGFVRKAATGTGASFGAQVGARTSASSTRPAGPLHPAERGRDRDFSAG